MNKFKPSSQDSKSIVVFFLIILVLIISSCRPKAEYDNFTSDPISTVFHGSIIGTDGNVITPSENFILGVQEYYIATILKNLKQSYPKIGVEIRRKIDASVANKVLANAIFIDWLLEKEQPDEILDIAPANNALRWYYLLNIQKNPILPTGGEPWAKGIETEIAVKFVNAGMDIFIGVDTGAKYQQDCLDAGVPVPDKLFDDKWVRLGLYGHQEQFGKTELSIYRNEAPAGFCLSTTHYANENSVSGRQALICLGTQTNNACFFEGYGIDFGGDTNINDVDYSLSMYCTGCHVGENPFIVHPQDPVFTEAARLKSEFLDPPGTLPNLMSTDWYTPMFNHSIVESPGFHGSNNPDPININDLDSVFVGSGGPVKKCTTCHKKDSSAGRFPKYSTTNSYCGSVLSKSLGVSPTFPATMPMFDLANADKYIHNINQLQWLVCNKKVDDVQVFMD